MPRCLLQLDCRNGLSDKILIVIVVVVLVVGLSAMGSYNSLVGLQQATNAQWAAGAECLPAPDGPRPEPGEHGVGRSQFREVDPGRSDRGPRVGGQGAAARGHRAHQPGAAGGLRAGAGPARLGALPPPRRLGAATRTSRRPAGFRDLQAQLEGTENRIAVERGRFNEAVRAYDTAIRRFPAAIIAGTCNFASRPYFTATPGSETPPTVKFDFNATPAPAKP